MKEKLIQTEVSAHLIDCLLSRGTTKQQIAKTIGLSESFVNQVVCKQESLTIEHLLKLQDAIGEPVSSLLLEAISKESSTGHLAPLYRKVREILTVASEYGSPQGGSTGKGGDPKQ